MAEVDVSYVLFLVDGVPWGGGAGQVVEQFRWLSYKAAPIIFKTISRAYWTLVPRVHLL